MGAGAIDCGWAERDKPATYLHMYHHRVTDAQSRDLAVLMG